MHDGCVAPGGWHIFQLEGICYMQDILDPALRGVGVAECAGVERILAGDGDTRKLIKLEIRRTGGDNANALPEG